MSPQKRRNFTFSLVDDNERVIEIVRQFPAYAFIKHDLDDTEHVHYHYYIEFPNPRSFDSVANDLGIPVHMLQKVLSKTGILQYLTHENDPNKHHYSFDSVETNLSESAFIDGKNFDRMQLFDDYVAVRESRMTPREFYGKYNMYCATLNIESTIRLFSRLYEAYGTASLSRSEFLVPESDHKNNVG